MLAVKLVVKTTTNSIYDNSQVTTERVKIQNNADAVAYSTMNVLSRDMNFMAYMNRSMVANQVSIGQMVGLSSWFHMTDQVVINIDLVAKVSYLVPPLGAIINKITGTLKKFSNKTRNYLDKATGKVIMGIDKWISALSYAQYLFQAATAEMAIATFDKVAKANDPDVDTGYLLSKAFVTADLIKSWEEEIGRADTAYANPWSKERKLEKQKFEEFSKVVASSRDPFTRKRSDDWTGWLGASVPGLLSVGVRAKKRGGSDFTSRAFYGRLRWEWTSMDTVSIRRRWKIEILGVGLKDKKTELIPLGWGAAHALSTNNYSTYYDYNKKKNRNATPDHFIDGRVDKERKKDRVWGNSTWKNKTSHKLGAGMMGIITWKKQKGFKDFTISRVTRKKMLDRIWWLL
ncbi:hypothetical protein [Pleionea litopenaei]|uniref:Uncharacterized protein n=1 Tax=Pleionea litopenaei TaxID=3070815 RepID=A0AA51RTA9_9GAMM|nr:hypothetical protein [Pleionea sp. HL-JVS1]WMS87237.1 hypothetical protein Q9312_18690 [Pleionea sp. HL-JVS1]